MKMTEFQKSHLETKLMLLLAERKGSLAEETERFSEKLVPYIDSIIEREIKKKVVI